MDLISEEEGGHNDEPEYSWRKPPMLRKKSGELVRPALRSTRGRRSSSMPETPTFSKAVHFDQHLEHVRHFLQVDRPSAVSAGSPPVESSMSNTEFSEEDSENPLFEWVIVSNFPTEAPERLRQPVRVEQILLSVDNKTLLGSVAVANLAFQKTVAVRFTFNYWKTISEVLAEYNNDIRWKEQADGYDQFNFNIKLADQTNLEEKTMFFCVRYAVNGIEYWDNNNWTNFQVNFRRKVRPECGKNVMQPEPMRPKNGPRWSQKRPASLCRNLSMPAPFYDSAEDDFSAFVEKPLNGFLGEGGLVRLKGAKSAADIGLDKHYRVSSSPSGQTFFNRYDFRVSLSAAVQVTSAATGNHSGIAIEMSAKVPDPAPAVSLNKETSVPIVVSQGHIDSPWPTSSDKPVLVAQSYDELLDRYCFVRPH
jgi:Carbohydrate/starch-binding module (family 21)